MEFFSSEELISSFVNHQNFVNPKSIENETFTDLQIDRLGALLMKSHRDIILFEIINQLKTGKTLIMKGMSELSKLPEFKDLLYELLQISILMRGWPGEGVYPLKSKDTSGEVNEVLLTEKLMNLKNKLKGEWELFNKLRLIKYKNNEFTFHENYPTLKDRFKVVLDNDNDNDNVYACIRMTSNIFAFTSWYYPDHFYN